MKAILAGAVISALGAASLPLAGTGAILGHRTQSKEVPVRWLSAALLVAAVATPVLAQDPPKPKLKRLPNLISTEEIDAIKDEVTSAYEIVQRLRPNYLRNRGADSFGNAAGGSSTQSAKVVIDGAPRGELGALSQIPSMTVLEIRYLSGVDASIQFGTGYGGGAILVKTR